MARADAPGTSLESKPSEGEAAQLQTPSETAPEPRRLEAQNVKPDLSQFDQLRLRHSINLLPGAKKSTKSVKSHSSHRRLNGEAEADDEYSGEAHEETIEATTTATLTTHDIPTHLDSSEASLYEEGTGLFVAQEQKRILLLQFYEVILNNPSRTPQVDPRIIKLMTNYLQTLEYVYVKQIQHHEESPPVLYDYRADNETAPFCDSQPVALPDQKFLNEDDDYFVKLFDQYNQQQLGVYMSPTQLKQQGLFRRLARHLAEAQVSEKSRVERERRLAQAAAEAPQERKLKAQADKDKKAAEVAKPDAPQKTPTKFKVIKPMDLDVNSDFDYWVPPTPKHTRKAKAKAEATPESQTTLASEPDTNSRKLQRIQRVRRNPIRENVDGDFPAPIDDPFPIQNPHVYRENIHADTMEILDFFSRQLQIIFERMDRLNNANRGLERWRIKPHWRDFEQAMQYFQALGSRTNRITDVLDLIIAGTGEQVGVGFMGHFFGQFHRIQDLNRRINNLNHAHATANIHLRNMHSNIHAMRVSMGSTPQSRHQHLNHQIAVQQMAVSRQSNMVSTLRHRMERARTFQERATTMANWFNRLGNEVAKDARYIRLEYIKLELMARNLLQTTTVDMTRPRNQRMCLRFFEATIPQMVVIKNEIRRGIRQIMPKMQRVLDARVPILNFMHEWVNSPDRRAKLKKSRKMKSDAAGKGLI